MLKMYQVIVLGEYQVLFFSPWGWGRGGGISVLYSMLSRVVTYRRSAASANS